MQNYEWCGGGEYKKIFRWREVFCRNLDWTDLIGSSCCLCLLAVKVLQGWFWNKSLCKTCDGGDFFPKIWKSKAFLGNRADVGGGDKWKTSGGGSHWKGMCTLNRNHRVYLLSVRESAPGWVVSSNIGILMFRVYCSELGTHKNRNSMVIFLRDNFVKQYYFCWQNSRHSRSFVLVHLLQFMIYLIQMPGINEEKKILIFIFARMSCLIEVHLIFSAAGKFIVEYLGVKKGE